jgi:hypothetical protein
LLSRLRPVSQPVRAGAPPNGPMRPMFSGRAYRLDSDEPQGALPAETEATVQRQIYSAVANQLVALGASAKAAAPKSLPSGSWRRAATPTVPSGSWRRNPETETIDSPHDSMPGLESVDGSELEAESYQSAMTDDDIPLAMMAGINLRPPDQAYFDQLLDNSHVALGHSDFFDAMERMNNCLCIVESWWVQIDHDDDYNNNIADEVHELMHNLSVSVQTFEAAIAENPESLEPLFLKARNSAEDLGYEYKRVKPLVQPHLGVFRTKTQMTATYDSDGSDIDEKKLFPNRKGSIAQGRKRKDTGLPAPRGSTSNATPALPAPVPAKTPVPVPKESKKSMMKTTSVITPSKSGKAPIPKGTIVEALQRSKQVEHAAVSAPSVPPKSNGGGKRKRETSEPHVWDVD